MERALTSEFDFECTKCSCPFPTLRTPFALSLTDARPMIWTALTGCGLCCALALLTTNPVKATATADKILVPLRVIHFSLAKKSFISVYVHEHKGNVVGGRALPPGGHAVQKVLDHLFHWHARRLADEFLKAGDSEHLSTRIENFRDPVGVEEKTVIRF